MQKKPTDERQAILLGVNIDHIATLRQARGTLYPDPLQAALMSEQGGADAITLHLREDRRHIQERDVEILARVIQTRMNLEMAVTDEMLCFAERIKPTDCCLVPERREELTTEGGLDVVGQESKIHYACERLAASGIRVSLFVDALPQQLEAAARCGTEVIELHTGQFAAASDRLTQQMELQKILDGVRIGKELGFTVNAGHGLNYHNVHAIAAAPGISELNIGHAIIARALFSGIEVAVREMKRLMTEARAYGT